jgi:hypothetical protein
MDKNEIRNLQNEIRNQKAEIDRFYNDSHTRLTDLLAQIDSRLSEISIRHTQLTRRGFNKSNRENFHTNISSVNQIENEIESLVLEYNFLVNSKNLTETKIKELNIKERIFNNIFSKFDQDDLYAKSFHLELELKSIKRDFNNLYETHTNNENSYNTAHHPRAAFGLISNRGGYNNKSKHTDMSMKDIKELCKANQIKLSKTVNDARVVYTKKELITKLKRKKLL